MSDSRLNQALNRLRMRQVALLLAIHERRGLRAAAEFLGMSHAAASKMLRELEEILGYPMVVRDSRGLVLNESGDLALRAFREMRASLAALQHRLLQLHTPVPDLPHFRLGHGDADLPATVILALRTGQQSHASKRLSCRYMPPEAARTALLDDEIDVYVATELPELLPSGTMASLDPKLLFMPAGCAGMAVLLPTQNAILGEVGSHCSAVPWAALGNKAWVVPALGSVAHDTLRNALQARGVEWPAAVWEATSFGMALQLAVPLQHLVVWPRYLVDTALSASVRWAILPMEVPTPIAWGLWCNSAHSNRTTVKALSAALSAACELDLKTSVSAGA